jgi:hypothetical protein
MDISATSGGLYVIGLPSPSLGVFARHGGPKGPEANIDNRTSAASVARRDALSSLSQGIF